MSKNPPLAIRPIQCDLTEALGELKNLWALIQLVVFGTILDKELEPRKEYVDVLAKRLPLTDSLLPGRRLHRIYRDMDTLWSCRRRTDVSVTRRTHLRRARFPWVFVVHAAGRY